MFKQLIKQASVSTLASAIVSAKIPTYGTHHALFLRCRCSSGTLTRANVLADISNIVVRLNGEQIIDCSGLALADLNRYYRDASTGYVSTHNVADACDLTATTGDFVIPIWFDRPDLATDSERQLTALGMKDISSFTVDITCGSGVNAANHVGNVDIFSLVSPQDRRLGQHVRIQKYPFTLGTGTSGIEFATLPKEPNSGYLALHLYHATVAVTSVTVKIGGRSIIDTVPPSVQMAMATNAQRTKQSLYNHVDFGHSKDLLKLGFLPMAGVQDFRVICDFASDPSAGALTIIAERIYGLNVKM